MANFCDGVTSGLAMCTRRGPNEIDGFHFCAQHLRIYNQARERNGGPRPPERCHVISSHHNFCRNNCAPDEFVCERHLPPIEHGPVDWNNFNQEFVALNLPVQLLGDMFVGGRPDPPPALPALHVDPQNVHRKEVSEQTNKATEFLFNVKLPKDGQNELWKLPAAKFIEFAGPKLGLYVDVMNDLDYWMNMDMCRKADDWLYCRLMYGLIVYIQASEHKEDLWKRLWEECCDALGMCCEGHISRVCNVLVGYVEGLGPPISLGELIQQKMSAIASQDIPEEDKRRMATEFFVERGVPDADRAAWLDAF